MIKKIIILLSIFSVILFSKYTYGVGNTSGLVDNIFQKAVDKNFKPINKRAETFLTNFNSKKDYCFGPKRIMTYTECVDYIEKIFSINSDEFVMGSSGYAKACEKALEETIKETTTKTIAATDAVTILDKNGNGKSCTELYIFKLEVFKSVAYDILKKNKYAVLKDEHKKYTKQIRNKYDTLLDLVRTNIAYIERLWKKWPSKTKK